MFACTSASLCFRFFSNCYCYSLQLATHDNLRLTTTCNLLQVATYDHSRNMFTKRIHGTFPDRLLRTCSRDIFSRHVHMTCSRSTFTKHFHGPCSRISYTPRFQQQKSHHVFTPHFCGTCSRYTLATHFHDTVYTLVFHENHEQSLNMYAKSGVQKVMLK